MRKYCHIASAAFSSLLALAGLTLTGMASGQSHSKSAPKFQAKKPTAQPDKYASLVKAISDACKEGHIVGCSLVVVKDGKVALVKGIGYRDLAAKKPVTGDTLFAIGSSSKAFTAMTMMMSVDEGKLALTDSPKKYLPYFSLQDPDADSNITISDLMSHRSGLPRTDTAWATGRLTSEEIIRVAGLAKPTAKLGQAFQYQNVMFLAAGQVVGTVQNKPWTEFVADRIFKPLGMARTETSIATMQADTDHSLGYTWDEDTKSPDHLPMRNLIAIAPAGAINSSANDMSHWLRLMLNGGELDGKRYVSPKSFSELFVKRMVMSPAMSYGYGWILHDWHGHPIMEHGGNIDGFTAEVALMPDQHLGFALLTNQNAAPISATSIDIVFENLLNIPADKSSAGKGADKPGVPTAPEKEPGVYKINGAAVEVTVEYIEKGLTLTVPGQPTFKLLSMGGRSYKLAGLPGFTLTFRSSTADAAVTEMEMKQPQGNFVATREPKVAPTEPLISASDLMTKAIEAIGGEANIRKHHSTKTVILSILENDGLIAISTELTAAPSKFERLMSLKALGKEIATTREYFDGEKSKGGVTSSLQPNKVFGKKELAQAKSEGDYYSELNWNKLYSKVVVSRKIKLPGYDEDVYVVIKTPMDSALTPITDYISTKSYFVVKSEKSILTGAGPLPTVETFSDYRDVDGIKLAFHRTSELLGNHTDQTIQSIIFDGEVPAGAFTGDDNPQATRPMTKR